jgi:hypothetical protein
MINSRSKTQSEKSYTNDEWFFMAELRGNLFLQMRSEKTPGIADIVFLTKRAIGRLFPAAPFLWLVFLSGCGFIITPPPLPSNPAQVFLLDHGRHSSLVLPSDNETIRYSYGDWDWYVLNQRGIRKASRALFQSTPAALARQKLSAVPQKKSVRRAVQVPIENIFSITVEVDKIVSLKARLEHIFAENRQQLYHDPSYGMDFVPYPEPYSLGHNSNQVVAQWLRELGAEVRGGGPFSRWKLSESP